MGKIISLANQKGGVGKSTSAINIAAGLGQMGKRTLLVDLDPQGNTTSGVGINKKQIKTSSYDILISRADAYSAIVKTNFENLSILPSNITLAGAEFELVDADNRENRFKAAMDKVSDSYDYILVDCPPSLGLLTLNALVASDGVVVPMLCEYFSLEGLTQLMITIREVKKRFNPALDLSGILITMYNGRLNLSAEVLHELKKYYSDKLFKTMIPRSVRISEAPSYGEPIQYYDRRSKAAEAYNDVVKELILRI